MFDLAEEAFDEVTFPVERCIERPAHGGRGAARDDRDRATGSGGIKCALGIVSLVGEDEAGAEAVKQRFDLSDIVALAARQEDAHRKAERVGDDMDLGAQPALGTAERVSLSPFLRAPALC